MKLLKLKGKIAEKGLTQTYLADKLDLSLQGLNAKLNGRAVFNLTEIKKLVDELEIEESEVGLFFLN